MASWSVRSTLEQSTEDANCFVLSMTLPKVLVTQKHCPTMKTSLTVTCNLQQITGRSKTYVSIRVRNI